MKKRLNKKGFKLCAKVTNPLAPKLRILEIKLPKFNENKVKAEKTLTFKY